VEAEQQPAAIQYPVGVLTIGGASRYVLMTQLHPALAEHAASLAINDAEYKPKAS
jgi:hypothetical protein